MPSLVYDTFWRFAAERQLIFFKRLEDHLAPWTQDPILRTFKFTNVYRASDRVSQYLIRNVIYRHDLPDDPEEVVFRILLFKFFNKIETWKLLERVFTKLTYRAFDSERYERVLSRALSRGERIYSAAYIMPSGRKPGTRRKHRAHLHLIDQMMKDRLPSRLLEAGSMRQAFSCIRAYPTIGDFLGYQYLIDVNYSPVMNFDEMEFIVPGPGAIEGIRRCFRDTGGMSDADLIRAVTDRQESEFERLGLDFRTLWGRRLQLVDCQNVFCEVAKYARVAHPEGTGGQRRKRIKQRFRPSADPITYWYPPKWRINRFVMHLGKRRTPPLAHSWPGEDD